MFEFGRRFLFLINKIENNTIHITQLLQNGSLSTSSDSLTYAADGGLAVGNAAEVPCLTPMTGGSFFDPFNASMRGNLSSNANYDSSGAARYIVVVVLVYGFAIIFFIGSQVRSTKKFSDEVDGVNAEKILRSMETEIFTKEVLEKLSNKEHREKAWKIYLSNPNTGGTSTASDKRRNSVQLKHFIKTDENLKEIDKEAVESIEKKLKLLNKVQSNYKNQRIDAEIETVKEVLRPSPKQTNRLVDCKNFLKSTLRIKKKPPVVIHQNAPLLILQTDVEGLIKLKQSNSKMKKSDHGLNQMGLEPDQNEDYYEYEHDAKNRASASFVSFDACEISEQITSV